MNFIALNFNNTCIVTVVAFSIQIHYVIQLNSGNTGLMESPRADISLRGTIPKVDTEFHINFPCTFRQSGTTFVAITFTFFDEHGMPMYEMPFTLAMKRACVRGMSIGE